MPYLAPQFASLLARLLLPLLLFGLVESPAIAGSLKWEPLEVVTHHGVRRFRVEVADTEASRGRGLMYRKSLAADRGMLFDFKAPQPVAFWMKNTLIPLDMLFISPNGRIIAIARNATPYSETQIPSGGDVLGVLEIRGGRAAEIGIEPGDRVSEKIFHP